MLFNVEPHYKEIWRLLVRCHQTRNDTCVQPRNYAFTFIQTNAFNHPRVVNALTFIWQFDPTKTVSRTLHVVSVYKC